MKNKKIIVVSAVAALLAVSVILVECLTPGLIWLVTPRAKAQYGLLDGVEHIEEVPEGEIRFLINDNVVFETDEKKGSFMFENPQSCDYTLQFLVYEIIGDGETENLIYTSPMIAPGQFVSGDKLPKKLKKGSYDCVYYVRAYLDGEYRGERHGKISVNVLG
ncbi:MAG: hypothetical protein IJZ88_04690 [Clostridia bacterium]|nr:hypothetical protein [Clostridia bacterium]